MSGKYRGLVQKAKVQFLDCRRNEQLLISLFNVLVLGQEPFSNVVIKCNDHRYSTIAQQRDLHLPKPNTNYLKWTVAYRAMTLWKQIQTIFESQIAKRLLREYVNSNDLTNRLRDKSVITAVL